MTILDTVKTIGEVLTQLDTILADPSFPNSNPRWQQLYALRKHLDDQQRLLVQVDIDDSTQDFAEATAKLKAADESLKKLGTTIAKVATAINIVSTIASIADQVIGLAK